MNDMIIENIRYKINSVVMVYEYQRGTDSKVLQLILLIIIGLSGKRIDHQQRYGHRCTYKYGITSVLMTSWILNTSFLI